MSEHQHGHDPEGAHEHAHGYNSFLDRNWGPIVVALGCVFVAILAFYNPTN